MSVEGGDDSSGQSRRVLVVQRDTGTKKTFFWVLHQKQGSIAVCIAGLAREEAGASGNRGTERFKIKFDCRPVVLVKHNEDQKDQ